jgi:hypothetical protein
MTQHDEGDFQTAFAALIQRAYGDLFELRGEEAWTMSRSQLIGYFRSADKTSDTIGGRQAGVFIVLRELAGYGAGESGVPKPKQANGTKPKAVPRKHKAVLQPTSGAVEAEASAISAQKSDIALAVRIEINLPAEGTQETYDAIFKSIKTNLYP